MKNVLRFLKLYCVNSGMFTSLTAGIILACGFAADVQAAPFNRQIAFTQPDGTTIQLHGKGDEFFAVFETLDGYTVVFDPAQKAYCFAKQSADGRLISTGTQVQQGNPAGLGLAKGVQMGAEARKQMVVERWQRWEKAMHSRERWSQQKAAARRFYDKSGQGGPQTEPPPFTTTGLKVGLTLLVDFSDDPATVPQAEIIGFCNGDNYSGYGNNGSVKSYFYDNSKGQLTYTNVVTIYIRAPQIKSIYNDTTKDCGDQANILIKDVLDTLKALPDYTTTILPTFDALTTDANNEIVACNVFYAGDNGGVWTFGLWPHSWALYNVGAQPLGNGKSVFRYQITNIGNELEIGTFCHENGHMLCGYPDIYDYDASSAGGAGMYCLMNNGNFGGGGKNPVQICAYLKRASGWATTTELDQDSSLVANVTSAAGPGFNHFYRFLKPAVSTEYYLAENRQKSGRDADIPGAGVLIWHVDELGDHNNESTAYNTSHANYEVGLVQADNQFHLERNFNLGDAFDPFYAGNTSAGYANEFSDSTAPSARWWDGSASGIQFSDFSPSGEIMTFQVGFGLPVLKVVSTNIAGGNGNGLIDYNECNDLFIVLTNATDLDAANIEVRLATVTPGVALGTKVSNYPDLPAGSGGVNFTPFTLSTTPTFVCGTPIFLSLLIKSDQATTTNTLVLKTGSPGTPLRYDSAGFVLIPDNNTNGVTSIIPVSGFSNSINALSVSLFINHTFDADLALELIGPDGTRVSLSANHGGDGNNYGAACSPDSFRTVFDDTALQAIGAGTAPFLGSFRPDSPLAAFIGKIEAEVNGVWQLRAVDSLGGDIGAIQCWSLFLSSSSCTDGGGSCPGVDLGVGVTDNPDPVYIGGNLVYTISVTNNGPNSATNVAVNHTLPPTTVFVSAVSSQGTCTYSDGTVVCNIGDMAFASIVTITVTVTPTAPGTIFATAVVASKEADTNPANNSFTSSTRVSAPAAELAVGLADLPDPALVGGLLTYTVSVTNNGPSGASVVMVTNTLPLGVNVQSASASQGSATIFGNLVVCSLGSLPVGARATAIIEVKPTVQGTLVATAKVSALQVDPLPANNTATAATTVGPSADLAVTLTDMPDPVVIGSNWTYTITVTNLGPNNASAAVLSANLPGGISIVSSNTTQGNLVRSGNTLTCNLGALAANSGAVITIVVNSAVSNVYNASITATAAQADPNSGNNTAASSTTVAPPTVSIVAAGATLTSESASPPNGTVDVGETVTVSLRLRNAGNVDNTNLVATLLATSGVTSPSGPQNYGVLSGGGLPVGRPFTFTATGTNGGTVTATLQLQDGLNNLGTTAFAFALPGVRVFSNTNAITIADSGAGSPYPSTITVSGVTGFVGKVTVTLTNMTHTFAEDLDILLVRTNGQNAMLLSDCGNPSALANTTVTLDDSAAAPLPDDGQILSSTYRPANYESGDSFDAPAPVGPYGSALSVFAGNNPNGDWSLYVMDDTGGDAGNIANGWSLAVYTISPVNQLVDVGLSVSATPSPALVAGGITYIFTLTNSGPSDASGLAFTNIVPAGATLVSAAASQGVVTTYGNTVICSVGSLSTGATATVTVVATPGLAGLLTNTANVAASESDLNPANNTASAVTAVGLPLADVGVTQTAPANAVVGSNVTFIVTVTNNGPETALAVAVTDPLPAGLNYVSATPSVGSAVNLAGTVSASLGNLNAGASATVTIVAQAASTGTLTNIVTVTTGSSDTNSANNTSAAVFVVNSPAPNIVAAGAVLTAESIPPVNQVVDFGETVTVSLALQNIGTADTANLVATLQPAGGVNSPSGPQNYGALVHGSTAASRSFSFTASGTNGGVVTAALQLQDGATDLGTVSFIFSLPATASFANTNAIAIPDHGGATPYPSTILVSGLTGLVSKVTVALNGLTHAFPDDVDVLLVGPTGQKLVVMSDAGGGYPVTNVTLTLDNTAAAMLPSATQIASGDYQPTDYETGDPFPSPAPAGAAGADFSAFDGSEPNGTWSLYVVDDATGDAGTIAGGWSLTLTTVITANAVADLAVTISDAPDPVFIGDALTYTIGVTNLGPSPATGVTVTNLLPFALNYISSTASQGTLGAVGSLVTGNLGDMAAGAGAVVSIRTSPSFGGSVINSVGVTGNEPDLNLLNNVAQTTTLINSPLAPQLSDVVLTNGLVQGTLTGEPGLTYVIQASTNYSNWAAVSTNTLPGGGTTKFADPTALGFGYRFYRAVRQIP